MSVGQWDLVRSSTVGRGMATELKQGSPGNLPAELSSFVGRGRELSEIKRLLAAANRYLRLSRH